jgi:putative Mg2+ transporter-C (MgtC) family protein
MSLVDAVSLSNIEVFARLGIATGLGAVIGTEREFDRQDAGTRTHALLALGAALFGVISVGAFAEFVTERAASNVQVDVTRIASYVAAGVGFLGGGAIVKQSSRVRGLTTAASLWTAAAVGLAAGLGMWIGAVVATVATVVMLLLDRPFSALRHRNERTSLRVTLVPGADDPDLLASLMEASERRARVTVSRRNDGAKEITIEGITTTRARELLRVLDRRADVTESVVG